MLASILFFDTSSACYEVVHLCVVWYISHAFR